jgi:4-aminobutyrate aminotransferase-like enzyme
VSIGRYGEPRLVYSTLDFQVEMDELPEQRTVHLGVDLFLSSGAPVYAPLGGVVHSLADNDAPRDYGPTVILAHETDEGFPFYTLYGHLSRESLANLTPGAAMAGGQQIGTVGDMSVNGGWPSHLHFQLILDLLDERGTFPGVAAPSWRELWRGLSPSPAPLLGVAPAAITYSSRSREQLLGARQAHLGKSLSVAYRKPLKIVRGWKQFLYDEEGRAYLDAVNNVAHVGHSNPRVTVAGQAQMAVLNTNTRYLHDNIIDYAEALLAKFPDPLSVVFFVCSGSEANELALRLARTYTGRQDIIMVDGAYHGNTQALIDISPYKHNGPGGQGAPDWARAVPMPDPYRGPYKGYGATTGSLYATHVGRVIAELGAEGRQPAAFIAEPVLGCGGQIVLPDGYLSAAYEQVRAVGGVCIADEVQVGFGRVGSHFWGFETQGVVPDIVTLGKPMGNGHPLAAVVTTPAIADAFANGMEYFNTFGGNPVSCAIGQAVLDEIRDHNLQENARQVGDHLLAGLRALMERHPLIGDVRGLGLFVGVELVLDRETLAPAPDHAAYIANRLRDHGVLISTDGLLHNVLKIKPPIIFSREDADRLVSGLDRVLGEERVLVG